MFVIQSFTTEVMQTRTRDPVVRVVSSAHMDEHSELLATHHFAMLRQRVPVAWRADEQP
jgi:hypothetical protein